jgi:hypothetical protein
MSELRKQRLPRTALVTLFEKRKLINRPSRIVALRRIGSFSGRRRMKSVKVDEVSYLSLQTSSNERLLPPMRCQQNQTINQLPERSQLS